MDVREFIWLLVLLALYLLPTIIAQSREATRQHNIFALNFFLGWTVIGWFAALLWACTERTKT